MGRPDDFRVEMSGVITHARMLAASVLHSRRSEDVRNLIDSLRALSREAAGSATAQSIINRAVDLGNRIYEELSIEEERMAHERFEAMKMHPFDPHKESLAKAMEDEGGLWSEDELRRLKLIDPNKKYKIVRFNDDGSVAGEEEVYGLRVRKAVTVLKAYANEDKLGENARRELYKAMYGSEYEEGVPLTRKQREDGMKLLDDALKDMYGEQAAREESQDGKERIGQELQKKRRALEKLRQLEKTKPLIPEMEEAAKKIIGKAEQEFKASVNQALNAWAEDDDETPGSDDKKEQIRGQGGSLPIESAPIPSPSGDYPVQPGLRALPVGRNSGGPQGRMH